jgi:hypothetical protein
MQFKGAILHVKAGQVPPDGLLSRLAGEYSSCSGIAVWSKEDGLQYLQEKSVHLETLEKTVTDFKDHALTLWLAKAPSEGFLDDDLQPFLMLSTDDNQPAVVLMAEGKFEAYEQPGGTHSAEFYAVNDYIAEKLKEIWNSPFVEKDVDKFMAEIGKGIRQKELAMTLGGRGAICLVAANGDVRRIGRTLEQETSWGWLSSEAIVLSDKAPAPKSGAEIKQQRLQLKAGAPPTPQDSKPAVSSPPPKEATVAPSTDTAIITVIDGRTAKEGYCWIRPPEAGWREMSRKNKANWYKSRAKGYCPDNFEERPAIEVMIKDRSKETLKSFEEMKDKIVDKPIADTKSIQQKGKVVAQNGATTVVDTKKKDVDTHIVGKETDNTKVPVAYNPIIADEVKEVISDVFMKDPAVVKALDNNSADIPHPDVTAGSEAKYPTFFQIAKVDNIERLFRIRGKEWFELGKFDLHALTNHVVDLHAWGTKAADRIAFLEKQVTELKGTPEPAKATGTNDAAPASLSGRLALKMKG